MLYQAKNLVNKYKHKFWFGNNSFSKSKYQNIVRNYSIWLDFYPLATISGQNKNNQNQSVLDIYSNPKLLRILSDIGIKVIHTNPMQQSGKTDGGYDRIDYKIDTDYGTDEQYQKFTHNAKEENILIAGDIIPGHTGLGPDFELALYNYKDYPSLFVMREIDSSDWDILPNIDNSGNIFNAKNLDHDLLKILINKDYIPGTMDLVMFHEPGIKDTNWSVTGEITGYDGVKRRWLYLHWFKQSQPSLDWLNPGFTAQQLLAGDIVNHKLNLGTDILRIDANCLLGLEKLANQSELWGSGHPLSNLSTTALSMLMRKLGGYTYEENNSELDTIKNIEEYGPDLSYDFAMRTGFIHAIATGDVSLLELQQNIVKDYHINTNRLIHAMQNHDNLCYELVQFDKYPDEKYDFDNQKLTGLDIKNKILSEIMGFCTQNNLPFKLSFGGIQAHYVELVAARLNIDKNKLINKQLLTDKEHSNIEKLMLLAVFYNAMQPGVFQMSAWDLIGAVHRDSKELDTIINKDGDTRWYCRSSIDLLDDYTDLPEKNIFKAYSLFGSLEEQIEHKDSFINKVKNILSLRHKFNMANCKFNKVLNLTNKHVNAVVYTDLDNHGDYLVACNFSDQDYMIDNYNIPAYSGRVFKYDL